MHNCVACSLDLMGGLCYHPLSCMGFLVWPFLRLCDASNSSSILAFTMVKVPLCSCPCITLPTLLSLREA